MAKIKLLQVHGIRPIIVFDGARLPMKKRIEQERKKARVENRVKAENFLKKGEVNQAVRKFMESVEISSMMIYRLI
jgi:exonuclease-1